MELDLVRRDPGLMMEEIEKGNPGHQGVADLDCAAGGLHLLAAEALAPVLQAASGASAIIVFVPSLRTRWRSRSSSAITWVTLAVTLKTLNSNGARAPGSGTGFGLAINWAIVAGFTALELRPVLQRLHLPALEAALQASKNGGRDAAVRRRLRPGG